MTTPVIIDIIVVAFLAGFTIFGAKRGLFRALAGLAVFLIALIGAGVIATTFSQPAVKLVTPLISKHIQQQVADAMAAQTSAQVEMPEADVEGETFSITAILDLMGLDEEVRASLAEQAQEKVQETGATIATALVESLAQSIIYAALYILSFAALLFLLKFVTGAVDLVLKLPVLHGVNSLGGAATGLLEGGLLLFLAIWAARRFGVSFETETVAATHILRFFTTNTPLSVLSYL